MNFNRDLIWFTFSSYCGSLKKHFIFASHKAKKAACPVLGKPLFSLAEVR
jgi:hypothetical protein